METQQSTMTNLCGEELPLLFRRLDVGSLSEGIAFESRLIGGRRAADTTLGHTDCDLREVQKTRKTEISKQKPQRWMEILRRVEWWSNELDMAVRRTMRTLECRESKLDHKLQNIIQCQLAKCADEIEVHSTSWERLKTFLKPEKSQAFILDVCGARDNGSMHYDYCTLFKTVRVYECVFLWPAGSNAVGFARGSAPPWLL